MLDMVPLVLLLVVVVVMVVVGWGVGGWVGGVDGIDDAQVFHETSRPSLIFFLRTHARHPQKAHNASFHTHLSSTAVSYPAAASGGVGSGKSNGQ